MFSNYWRVVPSRIDASEINRSWWNDDEVKILDSNDLIGIGIEGKVHDPFFFFLFLTEIIPNEK